MPNYTVETEEAGLPLEQFLARRIPAAPEGYLRQLIRKGKVLCAAKPREAGHLVSAGEKIHLPDSARLRELIEGPTDSTRPVEILFESREILIVNKPAGLAVHSSKGHEQDNLTDRLRVRYDKFSIAPVQRLDLETSGPIIFGKGKKSCAALGKLFLQGEVKKYYLALVSGKVQGRGLLSTEIPAKGKLKTAETGYAVLGGNEHATLLELELHTGRQHQIRRQLADIDHPLFGDRRYRGPCPPQLPRLFLHCRRLIFDDPFSRQRIDVSAPLPNELVTFLQPLGLKIG
ncbi:MAG: hypothetical protein C0622_12755 [Desulfuromonas sp.]|nr:MAG: hypothetical protein C0622_12755 [Desulfuromonas sp.]